jgi:predicted aldo/keto reductase-like oxidoreductase
MTTAQCIHYALGRPAVASALLGCQTAEQMQDALHYLTLDEAQRDYAEILNTASREFRGSCVYCNHCQPCPSEIDIAAVNKYLDIARLDPGHIPPSVRSHYQSLAHRGDECIQCGSCEERCPFGVEIIENMAEADRLLG